MIKKFKQFNEDNSFKLTPEQLLLKSCKNGDLKTVQDLLDNGADIHTLRDLPLKIATEKGFVDIVKYLIEKGALVDTAILNSVKDNNELRLYLNGVKLRQNRISINAKKEEDK